MIITERDEYLNNLQKRFDVAFTNFNQFLKSSWQHIEPQFTYDDELKNDWLQVNWELLVESALKSDGKNRVNLHCYGDGAEGKSDRVFLPDATITHEIKCRPIRGFQCYDYISQQYIEFLRAGFTFYRFVTINDSGDYIELLPFNMVQFIELPHSAFLIKDIKFQVVDINKK